MRIRIRISKINKYHNSSNMSQAYYSKDYSGHYGLSLKKYVHFTFPIRRYADLLVHRQLHLYLGWDLDEIERINLLRYNQISAYQQYRTKSLKQKNKLTLDI